MCKLLMSINPEHVDNILAGTKKFEFRKTKCKEKIDSIIIYSTFPIMRVVAEVEVKDIIEDTIFALESEYGSDYIYVFFYSNTALTLFYKNDIIIKKM